VTAVRTADNKDRPAVRIEVTILKGVHVDVEGLEPNSERKLPNVELPAVAEASCDLI